MRLRVDITADTGMVAMAMDMAMDTVIPVSTAKCELDRQRRRASRPSPARNRLVE